MLLRRACACFLVALCCCGLLARSRLGGLFHLLCWPGRGLLLWLVAAAPGTPSRRTSNSSSDVHQSKKCQPTATRGTSSTATTWTPAAAGPLEPEAKAVAATATTPTHPHGSARFPWVRRLPRGLLRGPLWRWLLVVAGRLRRGLGSRLPPYPHYIWGPCQDAAGMLAASPRHPPCFAAGPLWLLLPLYPRALCLFLGLGSLPWPCVSPAVRVGLGRSQKPVCIELWVVSG